MCYIPYNGLPAGSGNAGTRILICQSATISAEANCLTPNYSWTPGGFTTQEVDLQAEVTHTVEVDCLGCGEPATVNYCMPIIHPPCPGNSTFFFTCSNGGSQTETDSVLITSYSCSGDAVDWSTLEFNTTHSPAGITIAYAGTGSDITVTVNYTTVLPGVYYIPTRVQTVGGIYSNWTMVRIIVEFGNCCN